MGGCTCRSVCVYDFVCLFVFLRECGYSFAVMSTLITYRNHLHQSRPNTAQYCHTHISLQGNRIQMYTRNHHQHMVLVKEDNVYHNDYHIMRGLVNVFIVFTLEFLFYAYSMRRSFNP